MNFGCGNTLKENYVNVDISFSEVMKENLKGWVYEGLWTDPHFFPANHFEVIEATDVLEHIHPELIGNVLYCMNSCLAEEGRVIITVPDFDKMSREIVRLQTTLGDMTIEMLKEYRLIELNWMAPYLHGAIGHQSIWTYNMAKYRLAAEGFEVEDSHCENYSMTLFCKKVSKCQILS